MANISLKTVVWKEGKTYVSWCLNNGVSSFGETKKEALESLQEALELYFEDMLKMRKKQIPHGTFQAILLQSGLKKSDFRQQ